MSTQSDFDFGNALVELDIAPLDVVRDALKTLKESKRSGDSLERILLEKRVINHDQAALARRRLKGGQAAGAPEIPNYQILDVLGSGGAGTVYRARQVSMDRIVAIKILAPHLAKDQAYLDRFFREARAAAKLNHPNLIVAHDVGAHSGIYYMVMEYVSGATLQQLLDSQGAMDEARVIDVGIQVAKALEVAHRSGMVHRDVKPANILLGSDGQAKLFDLGLAREGAGASEGKAVGTPRYISPEQAKDLPNIDIRSDLYSLGATMYHLVTGSIPFTGETRAQMLAKHVAEKLVPAHVRNPRVSRDLSAVISRLMEKSPSNRIQRPGDLVAALETIRGSRARAAPKPATSSIAAPTPMPRPVPLRPANYAKSRGGGGGMILAVALLLGGGAAFLLFKDRIFAAVESRDFGKLTSGGSRTDQVQIDAAAKQELDEIEAATKDDADFKAIEANLRKFEDYRQRYRGSAWDTTAMDKRKQYLDRAEVVAQSELDSIVAREKELLAANKYRDVYELYSRFPPRFLGTTRQGHIVKGELAGLAGRIAEIFTKDKQQLQERIRERKYDDALALLASMEEYALPDQVLELAEKRRTLEGLRRVGETSAGAVEARDKYLLLDSRLRDAFAARRFTDAIQAMTEFLYGPWTDAEKPFVRVEGVDYDELKKELDVKPPEVAKILGRAQSGMGDPANLAEVSTAQAILLDLRNAVSLELFKAKVADGVDRAAKATPKESWTLPSLGGKKGVFEIRDKKLMWTPEGGKAGEVDPWARLTVDELVALAARAGAPERAAAEKAAEADPVFHLQAALLYNLARGGAMGAAQAVRHFKQAEAGGIKGIRVYLSDLSAALEKLAEQDAASRFEEAKGLIAQGQTATARKVLEELAVRTDVKFVKEHQADIEKLLNEMRGTLAKGKKWEEAFGGKVEQIDEKRIRVFYDFTEKSQGDQFEMVTLDGKLKGKWRSDRGSLEAQSGTSVSSASRWRPEIKGDVIVEYDLIAFEEPQNIATDLFYRPQSNKFYAVTFGVDFAPGTMEQQVQIPNMAVIKFPTDFQVSRAKLPAEWEKVRSRIVGASAGKEYVLEKKKKVRVKISRIGKKISVSADGAAIWEAEDEEYTSGHLLFFSDCKAQIDNLAITFTP